MAEANKVPIKFQFVSEGTDVVVNSFKKLTKAEQETAIAALKLENSFKKTANTQKKVVERLNKTKEATGFVNIRMHKLSLALKKQKKDWTSLGISMETGRLALEDNKLAINKVDLALIKLNKTSLLSVRNTRNTHMAFSVMRSKLLLASFAVGLVERSLLSLVKTYAKQEQAELRVANALRATGFASGMTLKGLKDLTSEMQKNGVVGDEQNLAMASLALTYDKIQGETFPRFMKAMNDMAVATSLQIPTTEQLKSTTTMLAKALQEPIKGATALRRVGFSLSSQQQQQIKDFMALGETAKAQNIILEAAERQYANLAKTIKDSTLGAIEQLNMAMSDAAENMGKALSPVLTRIAGWLKIIAEAMTPEVVNSYATAITGVLIAAFVKYIRTLKLATIAQTRMGWGVIATGIGIVAAQLLVLTDFFEDNEIASENAAKSAQDYAISLTKMGLKDTVSELEMLRKKREELSKQLPLAQPTPTPEVVAPDVAVGGFSLELIPPDTDEFQATVTQVGDKIMPLSAITTETEALITGTNLGAAIVEGLIPVEQVIKETTKAQSQMNVMTEESKAQLDEQITLLEEQEAILKLGFGTIDEYNQSLDAMLALYRKTPEGQREIIEQQIELTEKLLAGAVVAQMAKEDIDKLTASLKGLELKLAGLNKKAEENALQKLFGAEAADDITNGMSNITSGWGMLSSTASMYFANQEAGWAREMSDLKNSDEFKRKSQKRQERDIKDLQDRQRGAKQKAWRQQQAIAQAQVIMDTANAIMNAMTAKPPWAGYTLAATAAVMGGIQLSMIRSQKMPAFAKGGDFIADRPQPILVGEAGRERVTITPVDRPESMALGSMGGVNINFSGNVLSQDFIEDEAIPMIKEAIRRGADIGVA